MARIKGGLNAKKSITTLKLAKGYRGRKQYRVAKQSVMKLASPVKQKNVSSDSSGSLISTQQQE